jgi:hypothetical protein
VFLVLVLIRENSEPDKVRNCFITGQKYTLKRVWATQESVLSPRILDSILWAYFYGLFMNKLGEGRRESQKWVRIFLE